MTAVFLYWSVAAVAKFASKPVASSLSFTHGDDADGHVDFPEVTICASDFKFYGAEHPCRDDLGTLNDFKMVWTVCENITGDEDTLIGNIFEVLILSPAIFATFLQFPAYKVFIGSLRAS